MAKVLLLIALCVLPALVSASRVLNNPLVVQGQVFCDRCRAGFETEKARNMGGKPFISVTLFYAFFFFFWFHVSVSVCYVGGIVRSGCLVCELVNLFSSLGVLMLDAITMTCWTSGQLLIFFTSENHKSSKS